MENNIKPNPRLIDLLCSIRSTQAVIQTFINDNEAEFINSIFNDMIDYLGDVQTCLSDVSGEIGNRIGTIIISDIDSLLEEKQGA